MHEGTIRTKSTKGIFDFMKTKIVLDGYCTGQIPHTFPVGTQFLVSGECQLLSLKSHAEINDVTCDTISS